MARKYLPEIVFGLLCAALLAIAIQGMPMETSVFADGLGKWLQIQGLIQQGWNNFGCVYKEVWDPNFEFLPGPWYVYSVKNGACTYGYQAAYALAVLPFVKASAYGYFVFNAIFYSLFTIGFIRLSRRFFDSNLAPWFAGIIASMIIPSLVFSMDLSEVILSMSMSIWALVLICKPEEESSSGIFLPSVFLGGILLGLVLALRTESALHAGAWFLAVLLFYRKKFVSLSAGYALGIALVFAFHFVFFGNFLGNRGSSHADVTSALNLKTHLAIAYSLLFGGPLGLISSLPAVLLGLLLIFRPFRSLQTRPTYFFLIISILPVLGVLVTAPSDGGYSWGPRFLALAMAPLFVLTLSVVLGPISSNKWLRIGFRIMLIGIALYSIQYTWKGRNVYRHAAFQNQKYEMEMKRISPDATIVRHYSLFGTFSRTLSLGKVYQADTQEKLDRLIGYLKKEGVKRILILSSETSESKHVIHGVEFTEQILN